MTTEALPGAGERFRWAITDTITLTRRNLLHIIRVPQLLVFSTIQPVMFVLLFAYVFGGAITTPGVNYIDFLLPGILVQTVAFAAVNTGIGLADDLNKGIIDRFRSLPMARSAVLAGRTGSDLVRNVFVIFLMYAVGSAIGFRIATGVVQALAALGVALAFGHALSWMGAVIGLTLREPESVQAATFVWLFPLIFASSVFVPVGSMPGWLQAFADNQPVTHTVDAVRALLLGGETARPMFWSLAWSAGLVALFAPLGVRRYRRV